MGEWVGGMVYGVYLVGCVADLPPFLLPDVFVFFVILCGCYSSSFFSSRAFVSLQFYISILWGCCCGLMYGYLG
jgi:hypothetical protein